MAATNAGQRELATTFYEVSCDTEATDHVGGRTRAILTGFWQEKTEVEASRCRHVLVQGARRRKAEEGVAYHGNGTESVDQSINQPSINHLSLSSGYPLVEPSVSSEIAMGPKRAEHSIYYDNTALLERTVGASNGASASGEPEGARTKQHGTNSPSAHVPKLSRLTTGLPTAPPVSSMAVGVYLQDRRSLSPNRSTAAARLCKWQHKRRNVVALGWSTTSIRHRIAAARICKQNRGSRRARHVDKKQKTNGAIGWRSNVTRVEANINISISISFNDDESNTMLAEMSTIMGWQADMGSTDGIQLETSKTNAWSSGIMAAPTGDGTSTGVPTGSVGNGNGNGSPLGEGIRRNGKEAARGSGASGKPANPDGATSANGDGTSTRMEMQSRTLPRTFVAVNVGTIAYTKPKTGASAHGVSGALALVPNDKMHRLLQVMNLKDEQTGRKLVAGWVLSSTCLPRTDIKRALIDFENVGYACKESHGVKGERRREIAGVVICVDTKQLRFLKVGRLVKYRRVVRRGRILRVRLGVVGASDRSGDLDLLGVYMPPRGSGARGFSDESVNAYVASVWGSLTTNMMFLGRGGRLMVAGDLNAELPESIRRYDRVARPADGNLAHFREMGQMGRVHDMRDWTYTGTILDKHIYSVIDHVFVTPSLQSQVTWKAVLDGIETDSKRHRALVFTLNIPSMETDEDVEAEQRLPAVRICKRMAGQPKEAYAACKARYHRLCDDAVMHAFEEASASARQRGVELCPAAAIEAIQLGTERAMEEALKADDEQAGKTTGGRANSKPGRPFDTGLHSKQQAIFVIHTVSARRAAIGAKWSKAPNSLAAWDRLFIKPAAKLRFGLPAAYWSMSRKSKLVSSIAQAYGSAVQMQILGAGGGHCATGAELDSLMQDFGARVGAAGSAGATVDWARQTVPSDSSSHYEALGVSMMATERDIRTAYGKLELLWRPDKRPDMDPNVAAVQYRRIAEAKDVLLDSNRRSGHDVELAQRAQLRGQSAVANGAYCDQAKTKLSRAGLRLAMKRWQLENNAIEVALPELRLRRDREKEADQTSYYANRMTEAARQGRTESVAYSLVYTHERNAANRGGPTSAAASGKLAAVSIETTEGEEMEFQPRRVLDAIRSVMISQGEAQPYSEVGSTALIKWARQNDGLPEKSSLQAGQQDDWRQRVFSVSAFQGALQRMRPTGQAAGYDGWLGVLLRWAPFSVQELCFRGIWPLSY